MIGGPISAEDVPALPFTSLPGELERDELERLWELFDHIGQAWWPSGDSPLYQRSQWLEFVTVKCKEKPSYLEEYRSGLRVLNELKGAYGEAAWEKLLFEHAVPAGPPTTRLAHFRRFVVEEFIKVWLTSGGFRAFGAGNYNSYVSGSRFAVKPAYRRVLPVAPESAPLPPPEE